MAKTILRAFFFFFFLPSPHNSLLCQLCLPTLVLQVKNVAWFYSFLLFHPPQNRVIVLRFTTAGNYTPPVASWAVSCDSKSPPSNGDFNFVEKSCAWHNSHHIRVFLKSACPSLLNCVYTSPMPYEMRLIEMISGWKITFLFQKTQQKLHKM